MGWEDEWDLIPGLAFAALFDLGLRGHHKLLDVGCGCLRIGRLLIPYLEKGNYFGVEPNAWLLEHGRRKELGDLDSVREARFFRTGEPEEVSGCYDYILMHSVLTHCGADLFARWVERVASLLELSGRVLGTVRSGPDSDSERGWVYPNTVTWSWKTLKGVSKTVGLNICRYDHPHPRQEWFIGTRV